MVIQKICSPARPPARPRARAPARPHARIAPLSHSPPPGERHVLHFRPARAALPQIRVETLIGSQANYEIKIKITIYVHKVMISYEKYSKLNLY